MKNTWNPNTLITLAEDFDIPVLTLADQTAIPKERIEHILQGSVEPKASDLVKLAQFFGVSVDYLCGMIKHEIPSGIKNWEEQLLKDASEHYYNELAPLNHNGRYAIRRMLGDFNVSTQRVIRMKYYFGYSDLHIAEILGISTKDVEATIRWCLGRLLSEGQLTKLVLEKKKKVSDKEAVLDTEIARLEEKKRKLEALRQEVNELKDQLPASATTDDDINPTKEIDFSSIKLEHLGIAAQGYNSLRRKGFETVGEVIDFIKKSSHKTAEEALVTEVQLFGRKSYQNFRDCLIRKYGFFLEKCMMG